MRSTGTVQRGRQQAQGVASPIDIPLPLNGILVNAKYAEVSGLFASRLNNLRSDGVVLELRREAVQGASDALAVQRIPFEFDGNQFYIEMRDHVAQGNGATFTRDFFGGAMAAYISSKAIIADGAGVPLVFDGTAFTAGNFSTGTSTDQSEFDGVMAHQDRLFFWKSGGKLEFYYGGVGAIMGALTRFPLDRLGNITGRISIVIPLTIDAGTNTNDVLCIITTTGHVVTYSGLNPGDANDWSLVTLMKVAPPLSRFSAAKVGGDVWVATSAGIVSMAESIASGALALANAVSRPVAREISSLMNGGPAEWQLHTAADGSFIILNRWDLTTSTAVQYIFDFESQSWTTADYQARYWHNLVLQTGFTGGNQRLSTVQSEMGGDTPVEAEWHSSWFGIGRDGQIASVRPEIIAKAPLTMTIMVLSNHDETPADLVEATQTVTINPDSDIISDQTVSLDDVIPIGAVGRTFQLRIKLSAPWLKIVGMKTIVA
jgi:hypothetical protein